MINKRAKRILRLAPALLLPVIAGCASTQAAAAPEESKAIAGNPAPETNGEGLLRAFLANDASAFTAELPTVLQERFGQKEFDAARKGIGDTLGDTVSYEYLATLANPLLTVSLWRVRFERKSAEGKVIRQDAVFRVISGVENGSYRIVSFNFL